MKLAFILYVFLVDTYVSSSKIEVTNQCGSTDFLISYVIDDYENINPSTSPTLLEPGDKTIFSYENTTNGSYITIFKHANAEDRGIVIATEKLKGESRCFWVSGSYKKPQLLNCFKTIVCICDQYCTERNYDHQLKRYVD